jgi:hypothetical protein
VYKDEEWVSRQVKKLTIHDILSKSESKTKNQEMGSFDQEFFKNEQISAKTKGGVFTRVKEFPYQDGYSGKVTDKGKDKKHKKEKRKKVHVNWTKVE